METNSAQKTYSAFSLIEMLLVMAIFIILLSVGFLSVSDVMSAMAVNNAVAAIKEDVRYAKRSAMFLDREVGEYWVYGIGVDFTDIENGNYKLFKWCSEYENFDSRIDKMNSELPAWDPTSTSPDDLPAYNSSEICNSSTKNEIIAISRELSEGGPETHVQVKFLNIYLKEDADTTLPSYILFESSTGRAFIYDEDGKLLNYDFSADPIQLDGSYVLAIDIKRRSQDSDSSSGRVLNFHPVSGRIETE